MSNNFDQDAVMADVLAGARVRDLQPGDVVDLGGNHATFVTATVHPLWPHLQLVVWRTDPALGLPGNWSHDALDFRQVVGTVVPATAEQRHERLRAALLDGGEG